MAYLTTFDEKSTGFYSSNPSAYTDAPATLGTNFYIAPDIYNSAYGLLGVNASYGWYADTDVYSMGSLNIGRYSVSASKGYWFYGAGYSDYVTPTVSVYNSAGNLVAGGSSSTTSFSVTASNTYYIAITGSNYSPSQYSLSYTYTPFTNYTANSGSLAITGNLIEGGTLNLAGTWSDANGLAIANSSGGYTYGWYTSSDNINWTQVSLSTISSGYVIKSDDIAKYIDCIITFVDDTGFSESVSPAGVFIPRSSDTIAPSLSSVSPVDGATGVAVGANFVLTFNEAVKAGTGSFLVKSGTTTVATISATDTSQVTFSGSTVTINPTSNLDYSKSYSVTVASGVIKDSAGNSWSGTGTNPYDFTTAPNTLNGSIGNDTLTGSTGVDLIYGNAGNDTLDGITGADVMWGGAGNDVYYVDNASDQTNEAINATDARDATGTDLVYSSVTRTLGNYLENLTLTGTTAINGTGNALANTITGNSAANSLTGGAGKDILTGGLGSDSLYGGAGDKVKDVFDFNAITESKVGTARDKVYDFIAKIDKIDLSGIDANTATAKTGDQAFLFNTTTAKANSVWYAAKDVDGSTATKDIIVYGDVNGDAKADFEIGLVGVTSIAATDFVL
jgi:Ca2+-binding RTX toxin-like protein